MTKSPGSAPAGRVAPRPLPLETTLETPLETVSRADRAPDQAFSSISARRLASPFRRRLPRFTRAKRSHRPPLALHDRDLTFLRIASDYRLITTRQYLLLFSDESPDGIYRRLQKLFHWGYLDRLPGSPNEQLVYSLARKGADALGVTAPKEQGERYVGHQLMVGNVRVVLTLAAGARGFCLSWGDLCDGLPVKPDGFFGLRFPELPEGRNRAFFFLEADRST